MSFQDLWRMSYDSHTIDILRNSKYAIPVIQSFHLFGITLLLGSMVILNLRLSGIGLRQIPMALLAKQIEREQLLAERQGFDASVRQNQQAPMRKPGA